MSEIGHNKLTQAQFHAHVAAISRAEAKAKEAKAALNKARKRAKADGILLKDLDRALTLAELTREEQREQMTAQAQYLRWLNAPIGSQLPLFQDEGGEDDLGLPEDGEAADRAYGQGFLAGISGRPEDNPHDASHEVGMKWLEGYREGRERFDAAPEPGSVEDDDAA